MSRQTFEGFRVDPKHDPHGYRPGAHSFENAVFSHSTHFINCSNHLVHVLHQNNLCVPINPDEDNNRQFGNLIIRHQWNFRSKAMMNYILNAVNDVVAGVEHNNKDLLIIKSELGEAISRHNSHDITIIVDRIIPVKYICDKQRVFLASENIALLSKDGYIGVKHPRSDAAAVDQSHYDFAEGSRMTGFFVEIVDNSNSIGERYIFTGKNLLAVSPKKDVTRPEGVYYHFVRNHPVTGQMAIEKNHCSFEEAQEEIGLYANQQDARTNGDPELLMKAEIESLKRETEEAKRHADRSAREMAVMKEMYEKDKLAREDYYAERKHRRSDEYEDRSTARKDSSDILKLSAAAIGGGLAVFGLVKKFL